MFTMKVIFVIGLFILGNAWASSSSEPLLSRRGTLEPAPEIYDLAELNKVLFSDTHEQYEELKKVKFYLVNGETRLAKMYLSKLSYTKTRFRPIIYRYLGMLSFIDGEYEKAHEALSRPEVSQIPHYSKICALKVLTEIILNKTANLEENWGRCQLENQKNFSDANLVWLETLVQLKLNPTPGITKIPFKKMSLQSLDIDEIKMMLKLVLYLNQEKLIEHQLTDFSEDQIQDPEVRELVGQIYFRLGTFSKSYKFVEDLKSPNSENIKGNLYLLRNKYELAYAQFQLALEQKNNSQNSMERLLPLAWLLKDWYKGSEFAERVIASPQTQISKLTLLSAFLLQKQDYTRAREVLNQIVTRSGKWAERDVTQIYSFVSLMENRPADVIKQAKMSCQSYDLVNCWVLIQMQQWENFPLTMLRDDPLPVKKNWEALTKDEINDPLQETVYVNQIDIEEMDDKLIRLTSKK